MPTSKDTELGGGVCIPPSVWSRKIHKMAVRTDEILEHYHYVSLLCLTPMVIHYRNELKVEEIHNEKYRDVFIPLLY